MVPFQQVVRIVMVLMVALLSYGCADTVEGPVAANAPSSSDDLSGQVSISVWRAKDIGVSYLGTARAHAEFTSSGNIVIANVGSAALTRYPDIDIEPLGITDSPNVRSSATELFRALTSVGNRGKRLRAVLGGRTLSQTMPDGRELRIEFSASNNGVPPHAQALYLDNQLRSLNFFTYKRTGSRWAVDAMEIVHFDSTGTALAITRHDLKAFHSHSQAITGHVSDTASVGLLDHESCEHQRDPTPECLEDGQCLIEKLAYAGATVGYFTAQAVFIAAVIACPSSGGTLCPAAVFAAGALTTAGLTWAATAAALDACLYRSGGAGDDDPPQNCREERIEISYDDGLTWETLGYATVCD